MYTRGTGEGITTFWIEAEVRGKEGERGEGGRQGEGSKREGRERRGKGRKTGMGDVSITGGVY